jgi:hypothetical protein
MVCWTVQCSVSVVTMVVTLLEGIERSLLPSFETNPFLAAAGRRRTYSQVAATSSSLE